VLGFLLFGPRGRQTDQAWKTGTLAAGREIILSVHVLGL